MRDVSPFLVAMRGTETVPVRCIALDGEVGRSTGCRIHARRSSTCRGFAASWEDGTHAPDCDRARAAHGLPPLTPEDWHDAPADG